MMARKYRKALESIGMAKQWPENLGVGKPYDVDERIEDFIALQCYKKLKDGKSAQTVQNKIVGYQKQPDSSFVLNDFLAAWILKESGNKTIGDQIMDGLLTKNPPSKPIQWFKAVFSGDFEQAKNIAREVGIGNQDFHFIEKTFYEILQVSLSSQQ
jgi:hypothetical protein